LGVYVRARGQEQLCRFHPCKTVLRSVDARCANFRQFSGSTQSSGTRFLIVAIGSDSGSISANWCNKQSGDRRRREPHASQDQPDQANWRTTLKIRLHRLQPGTLQGRGEIVDQYVGRIARQHARHVFGAGSLHETLQYITNSCFISNIRRQVLLPLRFTCSWFAARRLPRLLVSRPAVPKSTRPLRFLNSLTPHGGASWQWRAQLAIVGSSEMQTGGAFSRAAMISPSRNRYQQRNWRRVRNRHAAAPSP
jgi:hypothetical protein